MSISVIYLCYVPFGTVHLNLFIDSYKKHYSGLPHNLIILFNGINSEICKTDFIEILESSNIIYSTIDSPEKFDIDSYFYASKLIETEFICFLNTYSKINSDNWLYKLHSPFINPKVGVSGATGGYADINHDEEYRHIINNLHTINLLKLKKIIYYRFNYYPKILPHIRTNGFLIKSKVFNELIYHNVKPFLFNYFFKLAEKKLKSLIFEHGKFSMSNQLLKNGLESVIVDSNGEIFYVNDWTKSKTFWLDNQENLLILDNQTEKYALAEIKNRKIMQFTAWGSQINPFD